jgi:hypothetical protein
MAGSTMPGHIHLPVEDAPGAGRLLFSTSQDDAVRIKVRSLMNPRFFPYLLPM